MDAKRYEAKAMAAEAEAARLKAQADVEQDVQKKNRLLAEALRQMGIANNNWEWAGVFKGGQVMADKPIDEMSDRELQRAIAELRGYRITRDTKGLGMLICPDGSIIGLGGAPGVSMDAYVWGVFEYRIPNWPQDTHAAVVDLLAECEGAKLAWWFGDWEAYFPITTTTDKASIAESNHPARAISEAWLAWKRGKDGSHTENL